MTRTAVVVPNLNGERLLPPCLEALRRQTDRDFDVLVVDNGSTDSSLALLRRSFPEVRVVELGSNYGFARAANAGIEASDGEFVALLNNDTEPAPEWLAELVECLERHPRAAAAASKTLLLRDPRLVDGAGDVVDWTFRPHPRGHGEPDSEPFAAEVEVVTASAAACLWRRDALCETGLFDEDFVSYYEDIDLGLRARLLGWECWYAPRSVALHARGASAAGRSEYTFFHPVKNRWFTILKNVPWPLLARHAPRILYGEAHWWREALRHRRMRLLGRAYASVARAAPAMLVKRRELLRRRRISLRDLDRLLRA